MREQTRLQGQRRSIRPHFRQVRRRRKKDRQTTAMLQSGIVRRRRHVSFAAGARSCEHLPSPASRKGYSSAIPTVRCRAALPPSGRNAVLRPPGSRKAQAGSTGPGPAASVRYLTRPSSWQQQNPRAPVRRTRWRPSARIRRVPLPVPSAYRTACARNSRKARSSRRRTSQ